jgi:GH24 family phage-related lysozyme (muramidase)
MNQETIDRAIDITIQSCKEFEGCSLKAYHDAAGYPTIGYGKLLSKVKFENLSKYPNITQQEADKDLADAVRNKMNLTVKMFDGVDLSANQLAALCDFCYNLGEGTLEKSTLRKKILANDFKGAAEEFMKWTKAGGVELKGLVRRRTKEQSLFLS